jgi:hypothetical protein
MRVYVCVDSAWLMYKTKLRDTNAIISRPCLRLIRCSPPFIERRFSNVVSSNVTFHLSQRQCRSRLKNVSLSLGYLISIVYHLYFTEWREKNLSKNSSVFIINSICMNGTFLPGRNIIFVRERPIFGIF